MFKRKHKNIPLKPPEKLWLKKSIDFIVPHSLEDCCSYIETLDQGLLSNCSVYLSSIDQKQISFNISKRAGNSGTVWAVGYLQAIDGQSTRIVGKAGVSTFDILFITCIFAFLPLIMGLSSGLLAVFYLWFFAVFILMIVLGSLVWTRDGIIEKLGKQGKSVG